MFKMSMPEYRRCLAALSFLAESRDAEIRVAAWDLLRDIGVCPGEDWGATFTIMKTSPSGKMEVAFSKLIKE
jgi:hypothetical protein